MQFTVNQLAELLGGTVKGDGSLLLSNISKIETAGPSDLAFLANPKYEPFVYSSNAGAILVRKDFNPNKEVNSVLIHVEDPYLSFTRLLKMYEESLKPVLEGTEDPSFCHDTATTGKGLYRGAFSYIGKNVVIGDNVKIYPNVYVGDNTKIGNDVILYPSVKIYHGCIIGNKVTIHSGAVIGSDGFGFAPKEDGSYDTIPQLGNVILEDDVSIGANTVIDRATLPGESTVIEKGAKLDNLIQIAHNVRIGESTVMAAQTGVSGSTKVGKYCKMGGQVGIAGHLEIADNVQIGAQAGIPKSISENQKVIGTPAIGVGEYFKAYTVFRTLPDLSRRIKQLEEKVLNLAEFSEKDEH